jgi:hypothetical protein
MSSAEPAEHFVTLFDSHYLPLGLCLYRSLEEQAGPFHLWIVAVDEACADALGKLGLARATVVRLAELETDALLRVKGTRSVGEYCWTLTPFLPEYVMQRAPEVRRVTYLDADLYFFQPPAQLIAELEASGKHVQITDHAFGPEYAGHARYGRFCVQFLTFRNTAPARKVLRWWQERCLEWCYAREEEGKFGDQKYLDQWPVLFAEEVHILAQQERTVAPWNVEHLNRLSSPVRPVFYHFQSLKVISPSRVVLWFMYYIGRRNRWIYDRYLGALRAAARELRRLGIPLVGRPAARGQLGAVRFVWAALRGRASWADL